MMKKEKICKVDNCGSRGYYDSKRNYYSLSKGMCREHFYKYKKYGDPNAIGIKMPQPAIIDGNIAKIPVGYKGRDGYAIVDVDMAWLSHKHRWSDRSGYAGFRDNGKTVFLHNLIMPNKTRGFMVDHINRDKRDNRRVNLRYVTARGNVLNRTRPKGVSGYRGVYPSLGGWYVRLQSKYKDIYGGRFETKEEAAMKYNELAIEHHWEFAILNELPVVTYKKTAIKLGEPLEGLLR